MSTIGVRLPKNLHDWANGQIELGNYKSVNDYICDLIKQHQDKLDHISSLSNSIEKGLKSGEPASIDIVWFKDEMRDKYRVQ